MRKESITELFQAIDTSDWNTVTNTFHQNIVYERPGYEPMSGLERVMHFYQKERILSSGEHRIEKIVWDGDAAACWGRFVGFQKDGAAVDERFSDVYTFEDGKIRTRRSYFFRPAI